jgi:hypothetical protein
VSVWALVSIVCDRCNATGGYDDCRTGSDARENAKLDGWAVNLPGGRDRCPDCKGKRS